MNTKKKRGIIYSETFTHIVAALSCLLFTYTSISKFLDRDRFVFQMRLAPAPLMKALAPVLGWSVPSVELLIVMGLAAGLLQSGKLLRYSLISAFILLFVFELYILAMLASGMRLPCTCGGIISQMSWKQHLIFNGVLIILTGLAILQFRKVKNYPAHSAG